MGTRGEAVTGAVLVVVAVTYLVEALRLPRPRYAVGPGPAFLPVLLAVALGLLALGLLARALAARGAWGRGGPGLLEWVRRGGWRLLVMVLALAGYAALLERVGFLGSTALFLGILLGVVGRQRWPVVLGVALGTAVLTQLLFVRLLGIPLPRGLVSW